MQNNGWIILDTKTGNPYIHVFWPTEDKAKFELKGLLKPYPPRHLWRKRLKVKFYNGEIKKPGAKFNER